MISFWLSVPALLAVQLAFASLMGELVFRIGKLPAAPVLRWALVLGVLLLLPRHPSEPLAWRGFVWLLALALATLYALRPAQLPDWLWSPRFAWGYTSLMMSLIALWSFANGFTAPTIYLGLLAGLAGILAWKKR